MKGNAITPLARVGEIVIKPGDPNTIYVGTTTALRGRSSVCCSGVTRPVPDAATQPTRLGGEDLQERRRGVSRNPFWPSASLTPRF